MAQVRIVSTKPGCSVTKIEQKFGFNKYKVTYKTPTGSTDFVEMNFGTKGYYKNSSGWHATLD